MTREELRAAIVGLLKGARFESAETCADAILDEIRPALMKKLQGEAKTTSAWNAYAEAMFKQWGIELQANAEMRGMLSKLIDRVGKEIAPELVTFYVTTKEAFYFRAKHPLSLLLRDYHKFILEMQGARSVTQKGAQAVETHGATVDAARRFYERKHSSG